MSFSKNLSIFLIAILLVCTGSFQTFESKPNEFLIEIDGNKDFPVDSSEYNNNFQSFFNSQPIALKKFRFNKKVKKSLAGTNRFHECQTLEKEIEIQKDERSDDGQLIRICYGRVLVTKCEGVCVSNLRPSIHAYTGLFKECTCCSESSLRKKEIQLDRCVDRDGNRLISDSMIVSINEPQQCACFRCSG